MGDARVEAVEWVLHNVGVHESAYVTGARDAISMLHERMNEVRAAVRVHVDGAEAVDDAATDAAAAERQSALEQALQAKGRLEARVAELERQLREARQGELSIDQVLERLFDAAPEDKGGLHLWRLKGLISAEIGKPDEDGAARNGVLGEWGTLLREHPAGC